MLPSFEERENRCDWKSFKITARVLYEINKADRFTLATRGIEHTHRSYLRLQNRSPARSCLELRTFLYRLDSSFLLSKAIGWNSCLFLSPSSRSGERTVSYENLIGPRSSIGTARATGEREFKESSPRVESSFSASRSLSSPRDHLLVNTFLCCPSLCLSSLSTTTLIFFQLRADWKIPINPITHFHALY